MMDKILQKGFIVEIRNSNGEVFDIEPSRNRIKKLQDVAEYISSMSLDDIRESLSKEGLPNMIAISEDDAKYCEFEYRRWLFLRRKFEGETLPPSLDIDIMWHAHILDTVAYHEMCDHVFGYYFHHNPYFGGDTGEPKKRLDSAFENTMIRYKETFGYDPRVKAGK